MASAAWANTKHNLQTVLSSVAAELLWTAPEILRGADKQVGSQKGDVFSFGIILEEIILRGGPYEEASMTLSPQGNMILLTFWKLSAWRPIDRQQPNTFELVSEDEPLSSPKTQSKMR